LIPENPLPLSGDWSAPGDRSPEGVAERFFLQSEAPVIIRRPSTKAEQFAAEQAEKNSASLIFIIAM
jgi:hypothetical protein